MHDDAQNHASTDIKTRLLEAAEMHVPFDGWSETTFVAAIADTGVDATVARALCPRGAVDLAVAYHKRGDSQMEDALRAAALQDMKIREKITFAVRTRLELCPDREIIRRGSTLFALPQHAATGAQLIWGTSDAIWRAIGDSSRDINWYSKRATLSAVYSATVLYWLGDDSGAQEATWAFLDRRIENVMQFEKTKAQFNKSPLGKLMAAPLNALSKCRAPEPPKGLPGNFENLWTPPPSS
ncbi:COQ9 family protein [Shimia marina]|uniref:RpsU-divergently transcribed protein n=1 Tax=Shimia marina TaxID=321267 RepID=A0A0P1ETY5_9RHOB|nr:COQ9 family protein [Shimia marina]CUH53894.1 rpsU-divergently transcribed protein [Shimia marina]SFE20054.1 ubiquinone biosynthesis protein COQ9 [Shimia marina]